MGDTFDQFKKSLELANSLKKLEREKYTKTPRLIQQPYVMGLRGGAAILLVASFEYFLSRLFESQINLLNDISNSIDFDKLPDKLRVTAVYNNLNRAMKGPLFQEVPPKVERLTNILNECKLLLLGNINSQGFSETGGNPNGDMVTQKFKEVGISNIFDEIRIPFGKKWEKSFSHDFIRSKLNEIVRNRHVIAHTADTLNISRKTQNEHFKFIKILAEVLEKTLIKHIREVKNNAKK